MNLWQKRFETNFFLQVLQKYTYSFTSTYRKMSVIDSIKITIDINNLIAVIGSYVAFVYLIIIQYSISTSFFRRKSYFVLV